jgi:thiamine-phosphate pyrophosphorylase
MAESKDPCRLCLVTPPGVAPQTFAPILEAALSGGDVASLIITAEPAGLATQLAGHTRADGVHVDSGIADLTAAMSSLRPEKIVGAGGLRSRHEAMVAGERDPDYVFFGRLDGDTGPAIFDKALDLARWWAEIFRIPGIVMGGASLESVREARDTGIEFVALSRAVFDHPAGAGAAVAEANRIIAAQAESVR